VFTDSVSVGEVSDEDQGAAPRSGTFATRRGGPRDESESEGARAEGSRSVVASDLCEISLAREGLLAQNGEASGARLKRHV